MRYKRVIRLATAIATVVAVLQGVPAGAAVSVTGSFEIGDTSQHGLSCDPSGYQTQCIDPSGKATASYSLQATRSGALSTSVSTTSDAPAGYVYGSGVGGVRAFSYPNIQQKFYRISAGAHTLSSTVDVSSVSVSHSGNFNSLDQGGFSYIRTSIYVYFFPCSTELDGCASDAYGYEGVYLTDTRGFDGTYSPGLYTQRATFQASQPGYALAIVYFASVAQSIGSQSFASASANGRLVSLTLE